MLNDPISYFPKKRVNCWIWVVILLMKENVSLEKVCICIFSIYYFLLMRYQWIYCRISIGKR